MILRRHWRAPALALATVAAIGAGYVTLAQDKQVAPKPVNVLGGAPDTPQPVGPGAEAPADPAARPATAKGQKTRVFRLKSCDPDDVRQILEGLLEEQAEVGPGVAPGAPGGGPFGGGAGIALPGAAGGVPGGFGGGFGGLGGGMPQSATWRVATHASSRALVVRGSERDLRIASDLVTVLETPDDKPLPQVKSLRAFRLKHADADELKQVTEELEMQTRVVAASAAKLLIASGPDDALNELADLVKELDVEVKKDSKPPEPKKLLPKGDG